MKRFYLWSCITERGQAPMTKDVISLDPGVRIFMTGHSPRGAVLQVGKGDVARIYHLAYALDRLPHSKWSQIGVKHGKRWRMRKAGARIRAKIHQLVQDLHEKLANFLCTNFSLLPKFQTSTIIRRRKRKFKARTAKALATWLHDRIRQRLAQKSREYPWCQVMTVMKLVSEKLVEFE
ncbi:hypothetical protein GAYE_SCF08G3016 [Galdieria yellowstonensis]|uniref:Uncharacterized protein n=1 Tax=Galdieria yellowstonensis TaxID=3028027 RepID=A0AAV9ID80_9RHOD|nr:hypothetical protein GAYE_SCF08G3016 [Galdieria yellowstonensis]